METKKCFKCKVVKPLDNFYKHSRMADGYLNKCINCTKKDVKNKYQENIAKPDYIEKERKRGRQKYHRLYVGTGKADKEAGQRWINKYPEKRAASLLACSKIKCDKGKERHHWSYLDEHWLDIIQLTKKEHLKSHRFLVYDQERRMYRRHDTNELLNTKEKHESFIRWCIENKED